MDRAEPPTEGDEKTMLVGWVDFHRDTLAMKCEGLSPEQLDARPLPPSQLSLSGLLRHLAEIERTYFGRVFAGREIDPLPFEEDPFREDPVGDYTSAPDSSVALAEWNAAVRDARAVIADAKSLADTGSSGVSMRFWLVKTLNEYARHNGHADLLREMIDGTTGE